MREFRSSGSVEGVLREGHSYSDRDSMALRRECVELQRWRNDSSEITSESATKIALTDEPESLLSFDFT